MADAFTISHDIFRQIAADGVERPFERAKIGARYFPGRNHDHGVRGAGVAIDADRVETRVDRPREHPTKLRARYGEVGENVDEHRREIRFDHARAFRDPDDAAAADRGAANLWVEIRR